MSSSSSGISPASSATMASSDSQKADQIAFHFYTKLFYVVNHARTTHQLPAKLDKWFNLETPDSDLFSKEDREPYKSISSSPPPPLDIQVLLTIPELTHNQVLVHLSPYSSRVRIHPTPRFILLESFVLEFTPGPPVDVPLPTIYKHGIPLFRSLYTLLRVLPAWKLHKRLRRRATGLGITLRVRNGHDHDVLSLTNAESKTHTFSPLPHPMGTLTLSTTYLTSPTFQLDELESLLSSRFLSLDQRPFTPTLLKNPTAASSSSSSPPRSPPRQPSSLPRSSLGKQSITAAGATMGYGTPPPPTRALALRQQQQLDSSSSSLSPSNSFYNNNTETNAPGTTGTGTAGTQRHSLTQQPRYPFPFKSNTVSSSTPGGGTVFPSSSLGSHHSVGGSGQPSSLSDRLAQYDRERVASFPHHTPSPDLSGSQRTGPVPLHVRQVSISRPISQQRESPDESLGAGGAAASTSASTTASGTRKRYSSSFGHRYTPQGAGGGGVPGTSSSPSTSSPAQRSISHQHSPSSPSLIQPAPSPSPTHPHYLHTSSPRPPSRTQQSPTSPLFGPIPTRHPGRSSIGTQVRTDDEDISLFVQDIDTAKPLVGRARTPVTSPTGTTNTAERGRTTTDDNPIITGGFDDDDEGPPVPFGPPPPPEWRTSPSPLSTSPARESGPGPEQGELRPPIVPQSPPGGLMLTSEAEVDARLRRMNETFLMSLQGLGSGSHSSSGSGGTSSQRRNRAQSGTAPGSRFSTLSHTRESSGPSMTATTTVTETPWTTSPEFNIGEPPGILVRQGSQEVVGRMDIYPVGGEHEVDDLNSQVQGQSLGDGLGIGMGRGRGRGGAGSRFIL